MKHTGNIRELKGTYFISTHNSLKIWTGKILCSPVRRVKVLHMLTMWNCIRIAICCIQKSTFATFKQVSENENINPTISKRPRSLFLLWNQFHQFLNQMQMNQVIHRQLHSQMIIHLQFNHQLLQHNHSQIHLFDQMHRRQNVGGKQITFQLKTNCVNVVLIKYFTCFYTGKILCSIICV